MSDDKPVTRGELDLHLRNHGLTLANEIGSVLDQKFEAQDKRIDAANIQRRDYAFKEATGEEWEDRGNVKSFIQDGIKRQDSAKDTKSSVKKAAINYGVPITLAGIIGWFANHFGQG